MPDHVKHPVVLNGQSKISKMYLSWIHDETQHQGARFLVNYTYSKKGVMVTFGRKLATQIVKACETCRRLRGETHKPIMGQLPKERTLVKQAPFSAVAIDFVALMQIQEGNEIVKGNVLMLACLTTRVCCLELTKGTTSEEVLRAWRRFALRNGIHPQYVLSDSTAAFKKAALKIKRFECDFNGLEHGQQEFKWDFTVPKAPHRRGCVESLVKAVKQGFQLMNPEMRPLETLEWQNSLSEIEHLLNSRPLIKETNTGEVWPIDGNWVLHPYREKGLQRNSDEIIKGAQRGSKAFWEAWTTHVTKDIFEYKKWGKGKRNVKEGDKVLVVKQGYGNEKKNGKFWEEGEVIKCHTSKDGVVRKAEVKLQNGKTEKRAVQDLVIICEMD